MKQRKAVTAVTRERYRKARKKEKQQILDEFCATTGYSRGYARFVFRNHGREVWFARASFLSTVLSLNPGLY